MKCENCNASNSMQARYCRNCGQVLGNNSSNKDSLNDIILSVIIGIMFITALLAYIHLNVYPLKKVMSIMWTVLDLSYILLPVAIKNKRLKIAGFIVLSVVVMYKVIQHFILFYV
jgi:uncharacterized membrane protein YvbJ